LAVIRQQNAGAIDELGRASVSANGRFVAFASRARLVAADTDLRTDVYVLDLVTQTTTLERAFADDFVQGDGLRPTISADGRFLVFDWSGTTSDQRDARPQVILRDRATGMNRVLSVNRDGAPGDDTSQNGVISADGTVVAFESSATDLVPEPDANGRRRDIYVALLSTGVVTRVSVDETGHQMSDGSSFSPTISADGRYVAFTSSAPLERGSAPGADRTTSSRHVINQVFVRDLNRGITRRVSRRRDGREPNGASFFPSISGDGRWVGFVSNATNLASGDSNDVSDIYLHDLETMETTLVTRGADGGVGNGASTRPVLSQTGRFVVFQSEASNLVCKSKCMAYQTDINLVSDAFIFDRDGQRIERISSDADAGWVEASGLPTLDPSGRLVVFSSRRPIDDRDTRNDFDLLIWRSCAHTLARSSPPERSQEIDVRAPDRVKCYSARSASAGETARARRAGTHAESTAAAIMIRPSRGNPHGPLPSGSRQAKMPRALTSAWPSARPAAAPSAGGSIVRPMIDCNT
jgi:Tol biopolymer transport system component